MSLICPRCERPLDEHDEDGCVKKLSRRFFLGGLGTAFATAALAKALPRFEVEAVEGHDVVLASPKIQRVPGIIITRKLNHAPAASLFHDLSSLAIRRRQSVTLIQDGEVVHYVDPVKERLL